MTTYFIKSKHIVPTFIYIAFGTTVATLLFRWVFTINADILPIKEDIFDLWLPIALPWVPITIWLRPKLRILKFEDPDRSMLYQMIAWGTITAMMMVSNSYLTTTTGRLIELNALQQSINLDARFVKLKTIELNRELGSAHTEFRTSGSHDEHLNFNSYFVYPFDVVEPDGKHKYWYGIKTTDQISNKIEHEEKEQKYKAFFLQATKDFEHYDFNQPDYFEVVPHSDDRDGFLRAIKRQQQFASLEPVVIQPKKGLYIDRNGNKLGWVFGSFGIGLSVFLFALIFPKYDNEEHDRQLKGVKTESDDLIDLLKFLIPKDEHYVTAILLDLNILLFLFMAFSGVHIISPNGLELLEWGANRRTETMSGDWWRLISSMFLHGGIMHLFLNIYGLAVAAWFVEPFFGRVKYFLLYFVSGICGSLASIYWYENTISVGASGAIFGLYGAILGLLLTDAFQNDAKKAIFMFIGPYVGINLLFGLTGGIDNAAHIGGLVAGSVLGIIFYLTDNKHEN